MEHMDKAPVCPHVLPLPALSRNHRSSLDTALSERRVRLTVSDDGLVSATSQGLALQMLSLEPSRVSEQEDSFGCSSCCQVRLRRWGSA